MIVPATIKSCLEKWLNGSAYGKAADIDKTLYLRYDCEESECCFIGLSVGGNESVCMVQIGSDCQPKHIEAYEITTIVPCQHSPQILCLAHRMGNL
jgi:hypothetical protein